MARLVVQIPALNEQEHLPAVIGDVPRSLPGVEEVIVVVLDDGSDDNTSNVAIACGADHVLRFKKHQGLARVFAAGLEYAHKLHADYVVNIDADYQYDPGEIPLILEPLLTGEADVVIGDRQTWDVEEFSLSKRIFQLLGSRLASKLCQLDVTDAVSGFRAYTIESARSLKVTSSYTYTLDSLVQLGLSGFKVKSVPVTRFDVSRPSRLFKSNLRYMWQNGSTLMRVWIAYKPLPVFVTLFALFSSVSFALFLRFFIAFLQGEGQGNIQSLIIASLLGGIGIQFLGLGIVSDQVSRDFRLRIRRPAPVDMIRSP